MTTDISMVVVFPGMYQASTRTRLHQSVTITTCVITVYDHYVPVREITLTENVHMYSL
jgi:hypothetical protein